MHAKRFSGAEWDTDQVTPEDLAHLRRARDLMDRDYAKPLDVPAMARQALMSPSHFSRQFRAAYGETPSAYRARCHDATATVPGCVAKIWTRPSRIKEASGQPSA